MSPAGSVAASGGDLWLLGSDIAHSPSPAMHNAALAALGQPPRYWLHPCAPDELDTVLDEAERSCRGVNVTLPHKVRVAERYRAVLDDVARHTGAVNTVVFEGGRAALALNTDVAGLAASWRRAAISVDGRPVVLVGAGGAARAAVVALAQANAGKLSIRARRREAAEALCALAAREGLDAGTNASAQGSLLVVATPEVASPGELVASALSGPGVVHDLRYGPKALPLRNAALRAGHLYLDGSTMLIGQGIAALAAFLGKPPGAAAEAAMTRAVAEHLHALVSR